MTQQPIPRGARVLVVYFSRAGVNNNGSRDNQVFLSEGRTATLGRAIADQLGADSFEIVPAEPYSDDYYATVQRNMDEERADARPAIANIGDLPSIEDYDVIILGAPVWNSQAPMIMRTFLESYDFTGKVILPFTTHTMSGLGRVPQDYADEAPGALVSNAGLAVVETEAPTEASRARARARARLHGFDLL